MAILSETVRPQTAMQGVATARRSIIRCCAVTEVETTPTQPSLKISSEAKSTPDNAGSSSMIAKVAFHSSMTTSTVLLATAVVRLISESGQAISVRALLDSGSEDFLFQREWPASFSFHTDEST